ncbi:MAG TPA: N-acetylmuramoyl-L-alanine amidase, partial [Thermoleophilaceae bacterium]
VDLDEASETRGGHETYGAVMVARGARTVRVRTSRPLARATVLAMRDQAATLTSPSVGRSAAFAQPSVLRRADWQADESLRYDSSGAEVWPAAYYPVQKLIVHHTAGQNNDPDPPATIRAIYYYHAVTQGWGDIGYNFLIDEQGRIYEGRHTLDYALGTSPTEEDASGNVVTAAHAQGYNSGTVGVALLGTLTNQDATPAAREALEKLLAWEADRHALDPNGSSLYTNPVNGTQKTFPNIAGHRDVGATECPGGVFYATLPAIRNDVASMLAGSPPPAPNPSVVTGTATSISRTGATLNGSVNPNGSATSYWFQYGTTTTYGAATSTTTAGSGTAAISVSIAVGGLTRGTRYHFRLVAQNAGGTSYGADQVFRTKK